MIPQNTRPRLPVKAAVLFAAIGLLAAMSTANAQLSREMDWCASEVTAELTVKGCTAVIEKGGLSPKELSVTLTNRGTAYLVMGDFNGAMADLNWAIQLDPKSSSAFGMRGNAQHLMHRDHSAIADYDEAVRIDPKDPAMFRDRGIAHVANGDYELGIADYDEAIHLDPGTDDAFGERCFARAIVGQLQAALADCNEGL
ncbi:MAG: tetratricopeptide repeat protein, partial [Hyphomicrobiales bacterium]|nr:tetratricopeptide repeat protein [Hyphomicrobiales bacterium]